MIEQELETKLVAAIVALGVEGLDVRGLWNPVASGLVKGSETDASVPAAAVVRVSPIAYDEVSFPSASFACSVSLAVRTDMDPTGGLLATAAGSISGLLARLHRTVAHGEYCGLDVTGLDVAAFHLTGGSGPDFDRTAATWAVNYSFTVFGVVTDADLQPNNQEDE